MQENLTFGQSFRRLRETSSAQENTREFSVSWELLGYIALVLLAFVLRLAETDTVPMLPLEASSALSAWQASSPTAPNVPAQTASPLIFLGQLFSFQLMGANEMTARIATVFIGALLVISPIVLRGMLGRSRAFALSVFLFFSPTLFIASRMSAPSIWSLLTVVGLLSVVYQLYRTRHSTYGVWAVVLTGTLIFLADPAGLLLALILVIAFLIALLFTPMPNDFGFEDETDEAEHPPVPSYVDTTKSLIQSIPWGYALLITALVIFSVATLFLTVPDRFSQLGGVFDGLVRLLSQPAVIQVNALPLITSLFYEPFLWIFAIVGLVLMFRAESITLVERFFVAWVILAIVASFLISGEGAVTYSVWFTLPLGGLASVAFVRLFAHDRRAAFWGIPYWVRWVGLVVMLGLCFAFAVAIQAISRSFLTAGTDTPFVFDFQNVMVILAVVSVLFMIVSFSMVASLWNVRAAAQGFGLGILIFGLFTSLGAGWNSGVFYAQRPANLWHLQATSDDTVLLRQTMLQIADRETLGFPLVDVAVYAPNDPVVAWLLRDFSNARFVNDYREANGASMVVMTENIIPDQWTLPYVGQSFTLYSTWSPATMMGMDALAFWTQGRTRMPITSTSNVDLWLRQDIYDGVQTVTPVG